MSDLIVLGRCWAVLPRCASCLPSRGSARGCGMQRQEARKAPQVLAAAGWRLAGFPHTAVGFASLQI
ncbi:hypothetical protein [Alicyclobacillus sp. SO9]|uniref:hypothetical protein n=1 Tax=Alicyclobacillus sp. SO9 TaxID=2665646 RepID=UPI0018E8BC7C|nr:hypothetical protein [Alicyclobacillus sp. SO9]QQE79609.1 hypothetical protein GI364_03700 [Alicyclobacillus sp. SO9]